MVQKSLSQIINSVALCILAVACAKADYYEKPYGVLATLSADNDLIMTEGEQKRFSVRLTTESPQSEIFKWRIKSDKYPVKERFKTPEGTSSVAQGQKEVLVLIGAADVDNIQQGDQVFELELETSDGKKTTLPLTLLDVQIKPLSPFAAPGNGPERQMEFEVNNAGTQPLVKVLLVIDNSYSMKLKQNQLADGIRSISKSLEGKNLQFFLYTTSNDHDEDGRFDKRTMETIDGERVLRAPFQDSDLFIRQNMSKDEFHRAVSDLQKNILNLGHVGSKNESAMCTLNNILQEKDSKRRILNQGDDALIFILSDTDDHSADVPVRDCGGVVSPRKIISDLDRLLGRQHYGMTAVISNAQANKGHSCGDLILDEGVKYTQLVKSSPTPSKIFSICAKDYSEALDSVNIFSRGAVVNEFRLPVTAKEKVLRVQVLRKSRVILLPADQYEIRGTTLRVSQKNLRLGDRLRVVISQF